MAKRIIADLKIGDVITPPPRELSLWMNRDRLARGLSESALHFTVTDIHEGAPDKKGRWFVVTCDQSPEWLQGKTPWPFKFKARPDTPWTVIESAA